MIDLKKQRLKKGYTQEALAKKLGISRTTIANIECGFNSPSIALAKELGKVLNFRWYKLFENEGGKNNG